MRKGFRVKGLGFSLIAIFIFIVALLYPSPYILVPTFAQTQSCGSTLNPRAQGLVTTPDLPAGSSKFGTTGGCIIDPNATFVPFKIPTYDDLKSLYYDQSKATKSTSLPNPLTSAFSFNGEVAYFVAGDLTVDSTPTGTGTTVIFVNGDLNITSSYTYGGSSSGTLFIVRDDINITSTVTTVNAVLMAGGTIYTAGAGCTLAGNLGTNSQLIINGSIIALTSTSPPQFCRKLADPQNGTTPAEIINHQVKYLVLIRNLYSDTVQKWSEI